MRMLRNEPRLWRHFQRLLFLAMAAPWRTDCLMPLFFFGGGCCTYESVKIGDMKTLARIFSSRENFSLSDIPLSLPSSSFFPFDHQVHGYTVTYGSAMECDRFGFGTEFRDV